MLHSQAWEALVVDGEHSPFAFVFKEVEADTIVFSLESKSNGKILICWCMVQIPEHEPLDIINFLPLDLLVYGVFIIFQVEAIVNFKS